MASLNETQETKPIEGYSLLMTEIIIITLNILAVIVIVRFKKIYNPDILIFSLALADLAKTCIPMTMTLAVYFGWRGMQKGTTACDFFGWSAFTTNSGIMMVMTLMALDRYAAICWPFQYKHSFTCKKLSFAICSIFVFVSVHSILPLVPVLGVGYMMPYLNGSFCHFELSSEHSQSRGYSIYILTLGFSMLCVVIFCYSRAMCTVKSLMERQKKVSNGMRVSRDEYRQRATTKMNLMFARMMMVMMFFFCFSWLPFLVVILCNLLDWRIPPGAHFWSMRIAVLNSLLNPIIGATMCKPYRMCYKYMLCRILQCCGLCSRIDVQDPWARSRLYSVISRRSKSTLVAHDDRESGNYPSGNSGGDSGIDPGTFENSGPLLGDNKGASSMHRDKSPRNKRNVSEELKEESRRVRPKLSKKRISFMDDEPKKEQDPVAFDVEVSAAEGKVTDALEVSATGHTEGTLKGRTPSKTRRTGRCSLEVVPNAKPSPEFVHPSVERCSKYAASNPYMAPESPANQARRRQHNSAAGSFGQTPQLSPSNSRRATSDITTVQEDRHSNSLFGERLNHVTRSGSAHDRKRPLSSTWFSSLRRQSAPPVVTVTYFPVYSLNVTQTTAVLSSPTPTQCTADAASHPHLHSDSSCHANPSAYESVTLCNDRERDISTGRRTDAQLEEDVMQPSDHNSAGSPYLQNSKRLTVSESNCGVARCATDQTLNDLRNISNTRDTGGFAQYIDTKECEEEVFF